MTGPNPVPTGSIPIPTGPLAARLRPLWLGRSLALVGLVLFAVTMRTANASISPLITRLRQEIGLDAPSLAILAMIPPLAFAIVGLATPWFVRRMGLQRSVLLALGMIGLGLAGRVFAIDAAGLLGASAIVFSGMGLGNVLLPPVVKTFFPDRVGLMTTLYATAMSLGAFVPPLVTVPVADALGWRLTLVIWPLITLVALPPWIALAWRERQGRRTRERLADALGDGSVYLDGETTRAEAAAGAPPESAKHRSPWRSRMTWALIALFVSSGGNSYALFTTLPALLIDQAGLNEATAGALLALYAGIGLPTNLLIPILIARYNLVRTITYVALANFLVGYLGLLWLPRLAPLVWVACAGLGCMSFSIVLVLINLRTRTERGAARLSGLVQGVGYAGVTMVALGFGLLHVWTGEWALPVWFLLGVSVISLGPGGVLAARGGFVEDGA